MYYWLSNTAAFLPHAEFLVFQKFPLEREAGIMRFNSYAELKAPKRILLRVSKLFTSSENVRYLKLAKGLRVVMKQGTCVFRLVTKLRLKSCK